MRALYDPPFYFELTSTCLVVHKASPGTAEYVKVRMLPIDQANAAYPDVMNLLNNNVEGKDSKKSKDSGAEALGGLVEDLSLD
jgi:hypothetical protein